MAHVRNRKKKEDDPSLGVGVPEARLCTESRVTLRQDIRRLGAHFSKALQGQVWQKSMGGMGEGVPVDLPTQSLSLAPCLAVTSSIRVAVAVAAAATLRFLRYHHCYHFPLRVSDSY
ncbi:hypothetical protein AAFF_G00240410 [Aldrovandia affinis]|uniref:Uncharacterized protein n=1 Tax=Aldrovandia affinis TaxID=143900 RepID=A0AAD7WU25_9TELE|nr:hypothetical protein AAFF_G00240410 [Aldrovandia affinis]